ncbi:hypothetical protein CAG71_00295 [Photobacterium halotolerans]|nr:hypothetical protein [Photobacterium halotolerans]
MASYSIQTRQLASGEKRYKTSVVLKKNSKIIHREARTFKQKAQAVHFGKQRVRELEDQGLDTTTVTTIGELFDLYMAKRNLWDNTGRTKQYTIKMLRDCNIADVKTNALKPSDIISHCENRLAAGAKPVTIYHDVAYLRSVLKVAKPVFDIDTNVQVFEETVPILINMKLIGKSQKRTRRPTTTELDRLREGLEARMAFRSNGPTRIPFIDILEFSILTCMRIGEVCGLRWEDLNEDHKTVLVRDRKRVFIVLCQHKSQIHILINPVREVEAQLG